MTGPDLLGALAAGLDPSLPAVRREPSAEGPAAVTADGAPVCSARGCRAAAAWVLEWNNPRVHAPDRVKTWAACPDHREHLSDFLASRGFLRRTRPLHAAAGPTATDPTTPGEPRR